MVIKAGVEEAGRGPVIGPMVMAITSYPKTKEEELRKLGVKDSKMLTPKVREELFEKIKKLCDYELKIISNKEIDEAVNSSRDNLNKLEARTTAELINKLTKKIKIDEVMLDCPTVSLEKYSEEVKSQVDNKKIKVFSENKADINHPIVSAASIIAKVTRDKEIEKIKKDLGIDIGSGYPADPKTKEFLRRNLDCKYIRKSWATYKNLINENKQSTLTGFQEGKVKEEEKFEKIKKKFAILEKHGYKFVPVKADYEVFRMTGYATIIKYKKGTLLIQGGATAKKVTEELVKKLVGVNSLLK